MKINDLRNEIKKFRDDELCGKSERDLENAYDKVTEKPCCDRCGENLSLHEFIDTSLNCISCRYEVMK